MKINLHEMLAYQTELDQIIYTHNNVRYEEICQQHRLALMAELMELCNETRCFNYWSKKQRNEDAVVLDEMADVLSFTFSEAIQKYQMPFDTVLEINLPTQECSRLVQTEKFLEVISLFANKDENDLESMKKFMTALIELGYVLGYDWDTQVQAHHRKCERFKRTQR